MKKSVCLSSCLLFLVCPILFSARALSQEIIPLYSGPIPHALSSTVKEYSDERHVTFKVSVPTLQIFLPPAASANGTAVIICPGGSYSGLWMQNEGWDVAAKLNQLGVAAFVLKYRLPDDSLMTDKTTGPLQDAQQAIKTVRDNSIRWKIDPSRIGIMGFSAGGHLASTAGTHYDQTTLNNAGGTSLRPDFMILVYPVISFTDSLAHMGSRENLIGQHPSPKTILLYSNELQVTPQTPPAFLIHAGDDKLVRVYNSIRFYEALQRNGVKAGLHLFPAGAHGFPLEPAHSEWFGECARWLKENGWLIGRTSHN